MKRIVLLRGIMPTGPNRIPKMSYLAEILKEVGFSDVKTYIQSGNIVLDTHLSDKKTARLVHQTIADRIGADLAVIIKTQEQLAAAVAENPFAPDYDLFRVHLVFSNTELDRKQLLQLEEADFGDERFAVGGECLYLYLPREAKKKQLNTNYLEKQLNIVATMRK